MAFRETMQHLISSDLEEAREKVTAWWLNTLEHVRQIDPALKSIADNGKQTEIFSALRANIEIEDFANYLADDLEKQNTFNKWIENMRKNRDQGSAGKAEMKILRFWDNGIDILDDFHYLQYSEMHQKMISLIELYPALIGIIAIYLEYTERMVKHFYHMTKKDLLI